MVLKCKAGLLQTLFCGSPAFVSRCSDPRVGKAGYTVNRFPNQQSFTYTV